MGRYTNVKRAELATQAAQAAQAAAVTAQDKAATAAEKVSAQMKTEKPDTTLHLAKKDQVREEVAVNLDISGNEVAPRIPRGNIHRDQMMEEIRAQRGEEKAEADGLEAVTAAAEKTPQTSEPVVVTLEKLPEAQPEPQTAQEPVQEPAAEMVTVKVDGKEFQVSKAEVDEAGGIVSYQKERAATNRLAATNQALAETRRTQAQIAQWIQQNTQQQPTLTDDQFTQSKMDTIRFGTAEESAAALKEVLARANPRMDPNLIVAEATANIKYDAAKTRYTKDYKDILANPLLAKLGTTLENERAERYRQNGRVNWAQLTQVDWNAHFSIIGNQLRSVLGQKPHQLPQDAAPPKDGSTSQLSEKEARKASIVEPPKAAAARAASKEEPTLTPEEARQASLREMRKSRGLPVD